MCYIDINSGGKYVCVSDYQQIECIRSSSGLYNAGSLVLLENQTLEHLLTK